MNTALVEAQGKLEELRTALTSGHKGWMSRAWRRVADTAYDFFGKGRNLRVHDLLRREAEVGIKEMQLALWEQDLTGREADFDNKMTRQLERLTQEVADAKAIIEQADLAKRQAELSKERNDALQKEYGLLVEQETATRHIGLLELQARDLVEMNSRLRKAHDTLAEQVSALRTQADAMSDVVCRSEQAQSNLRDLRLRVRLIRKAATEGETRLEQLKQEEATLSESVAKLRQSQAVVADASEFENTTQVVAHALKTTARVAEQVLVELKEVSGKSGKWKRLGEMSFDHRVRCLEPTSSELGDKLCKSFKGLLST